MAEEAPGPGSPAVLQSEAGYAGLVAEYMSVRETRPGRIIGRIKEPIAGSVAAMSELFRGRGMVAYVGRQGTEHEVSYALAPVLKPPRRWVNLVLFLATVLTTLFVGAGQLGHNPLAHPLELVYGLPFAASILLILGSHELGHYAVARRLGVDATLPYFLPVPHPMTGTMGAFIRMRSPVPSRGALVKVGVAGPLVGFLVALPVTAVGLALSSVVDKRAGQGIELGSSLVFWLLSRISHPGLPADKDLMLHPVAFAGWLGLFVTALNLLPAGQLDGGHIAYAVLGRFRRVFGWLVVGVLALLGFFWLGWPFWAVMIMVFGLNHPRPLDDLTPLSRTEWLLAAVGLLLLVLTFIPAPFGRARV